MRIVVTGGSGQAGRWDRETLLSIDKARRLLGYEPEDRSDHVPAP